MTNEVIHQAENFIEALCILNRHIVCLSYCLYGT
jgi:hypothetical protein